MRLATTLLVACVGGLLSLGLVMLFSASMTSRGGSYPLLPLAWTGVGLLGALLAAAVDYRHLRKIAWPLLLLSVGLLAAVLAFGPERNGAQRWLIVGGISFQPSEVAKLALILALADYGERYQRQLATFSRGLAVPGVFIGLVLGLIFLEPDWGTTLLLAAVAGIMLVVAGVRWLHLMPLGLAGLAALVLMLLQDPTRLRRVVSWLNPEASKGGGGYQTWQSMLALGSGGWTGMGLGSGMQKYGYVPESKTDFIFPVIGEELGLVSTLAVVLAFVVVLLCGVYIARHARDTFGLLLATGLTFLVGLQAFINIGVVTNVLPNKGLPLPFISRGGSNLVVMLMSVGLLLSIARHAVRRDAPAPDVGSLDEPPAPQSAA
jgi:cell division protein FtsW